MHLPSTLNLSWPVTHFNQQNVAKVMLYVSLGPKSLEVFFVFVLWGNLSCNVRSLATLPYGKGEGLK